MFRTDPALVPIVSKPDLWWLESPLIYMSMGGLIVIPEGFISDDASVPHFLDWIPFLDRTGLSRRPGLLHDGLYSLGRERGKDFADAMLREACLSEGMTRFQADLYYKGVHWFGSSSYAKDARAGTFGKITSGDFITENFYRDWMESGATVFKH
jgi:hypothetical protein